MAPVGSLYEFLSKSKAAKAPSTPLYAPRETQSLESTTDVIEIMEDENSGHSLMRSNDANEASESSVLLDEAEDVEMFEFDLEDSNSSFHLDLPASKHAQGSETDKCDDSLMKTHDEGDLHSCPAQAKCFDGINRLNGTIVYLETGKQNLILGTEELKKLADIKKAKEIQVNKLKRLKANQTTNKRWRESVKAGIKRAVSENPQLVPLLKERGKVGRPSLSDIHPNLLETIESIAVQGGLADARRRSDIIRTVRTVKR